MVKKFVKKKLKLPSTKGSKKDPQNDVSTASSSTPASASTTSAMSGARAAYYASRGSSGNSNPFGDDGDAPPSRSAPQRSGGNSNPFGDDDDDDGGDNVLAGFARKNPGAPSGGANPFDSPPQPKGKSKNPFGDDDDDGNAGGARASGRAGMMQNGHAAQSQRAAPSSRNNNPFGDNDGDATAGPNRRVSTGVNPFSDSPGATKSKAGNDPFASEMKAKNAPQFAEGSPLAARNAIQQQQQASGRPTNLARPPPPPRAPSSRAAKDSNSNPFDDGVGDNKPPPIPKPLVASAPIGGGSNPFDDGPSPANNKANSAGQNIAKKRWGSLARNVTGDTESTRPIMQGMDEESLATLQSQSGITQSNAAGLASWLRLNKKEDERGDPGGGQAAGSGVGNNSSSYNSAAIKSQAQQTQRAQPQQQSNPMASSAKPRKPKTKKKCRAFVTPWPFDNYHHVQEQIYEELASRAASEYSTLDPYTGDEKKDGPPMRGMSAGGASGAATTADASKYYERPEELPSIKEAVNDLALVDFEKKAEERAINIVSTWLFDAGLIDELLVNGAMGPMGNNTQQQQKLTSTGSIVSEKTSEGQEIGVNGFLVGAEGAEQKMDKETNKLRAMIQRDLSIINARLNDGVAASGLEVQELVNAVGATKDDIGRLRELTTYISDGTNQSDRDEFLLAQYPYLRKAINARRNMNRTFRELEFFGHIPSTCERLRDELHGGEWTAEEWATIRNVSMEHVELEILLVEAENSMKTGKQHFDDAVVDSFLDSHVQNVWELGEEIRMRIISGVGSAFELSMNNPAGMVALVEAVEVYERAAESFEKKRSENGGDGNPADGTRLRFTNMRAAALEQLYQDFEMRGVEMFRGVHENAAEEAEEDDAANTQFTAVLRAATELVTEIDIVKHQMSPCFAPHWHVEALWSSCVAHVCSNHIVQQIGGPDGQNLPELTITQLLELVAWVEYFRETIEETFPKVASMRDTKKTYFEERPELFAGDKRTVNMQNATDSLAWVNNMLWEVHRLAQEEFLVRTRHQTDEMLDKVYGSETVKNQSSEGKLTTSLCEDVFSFSSVQLRTIRERLSKKSDALILAVCIILSHMRSKQIHARNNFLQDLETCCAASNDFTRMSEKCEDMISELMSQCEFSEDMVATLEASSNELMGVYSSDAVYSARSVHIYVFDPIEEEIGIRLFEEDWEENMVDNDLAVSLVRTLEDFHEDLEHFMDDFMVVKSVMSLMSAAVIFYAKCLLQRAEQHRNNKRPFFGDVKKALDRMTGDIKVMREYFEGLVPKMPSLKKNIEKDFEILATIHELLCVAAGFSVSDAEDFILVLQKRVRDVGITKHIVGDLWHLVAPTEERYVWELVESMEEQLVAIAPVDDALALEVNDRSYVKGLRLDEMAVKLYVKSRRNRPIKATAVESIVKNWRTTWAAGAEEGHDEE
eukprot:CAMPEP_0183702610 /NCGR_PEP_ID=MMETSP0737-20130205/656_1 /TAXON_ID=385413 /ORGANISM="Thalassiosira miniscula, Strain CCMP1093" /LENGTH=1434 /DNA_ID=CAMNT_0025929245 /DNA_START=697 /DNA_END=5001 /DNA_ORIENTATION=-